MSPFVEAVVKAIDTYIDQQKDVAAEGQCQTWDQYQKLTGEIQGLLRARLIIKDLAKKAEEHDD